MADIELSAQDKIEEYKRELAAEGKTLDTVASDKLEKDLARVGVKSSQIQDQYKIRRREGFPGFGFERQPQRTLSQILQKQEPPPAFFEGIPQAMQEAIARVNQQIISDEPFVSPNVGRDVETRFPTSNERVNVPPITRAEPGSEVRGLSTPELSELGFGPNEPDNDGVRFIPDINKQIERLRQQEGSVAAGEAMLGSAVDYLDPNKQRVDDEAVRRQQTGAQRIAEKLFEEERKLKESNARIADVLTQKSRGIGRESTPEERASVLNDIVISFFEATYPQEEISIDDPRYKEIQDYILSSAYTTIFKKQGLKENQVGVVVNPDTGLFKAIPKEPLESGVGQAKENVSEANKKDVTDFTNAIVNLASNEELSNSQRSALNRLSTELNQRAEIGRPVTEEDLKNLQNDERYRSAFNVLQNIAEDDPKILENVLGGLEVLEGIPFLAPAGRLARLARLGRVSQVSLKQTPGRPLRAVVEGVKVRSATPRELKEGIEGVTVGIGKETKTLVPVGTRASSRPPNTSLGRKTRIFMIPPADYTPDKIENVKQSQTKTLNFIIDREGFKSKPYDDGAQTSIGFGTKSEEGQQSITKQEAVEAAQEYLVNNVYPEIDFIQENGTRGLTENQITAVSSLIYNVGLPKWLNSKSRQLLLDGKFEDFKKEAFTGPNAFLTREPKLLAGLKKRRETEEKLFDTPYVPLG